MNKKMILIFIGLVVVAILAVGGYLIYNSQPKTSNNSNTTQNVAPGTVTIQQFAFTPVSITINKGDTVTWVNNDSYTHHIAADDGSFDLGDQPNGAVVKHTFSNVGTYNYHCVIHSSMKGMVIVK